MNREGEQQFPVNTGSFFHCFYNDFMTFNPYIQQVADQEGLTVFDVRLSMKQQAPRKREFPCVIHGRHFETKQQYMDELSEFLNGN
tara:strand:- start:9269 stop:9526 length:258 start_codon:yes stop_codon:yes gene_type:complete